MLHLAKTTRDSRDARALRARRDYKLAVTHSLRPLASRRFARIKDFFERETVASIVTEYDRDPGSNYADEQLKEKVKSRASSKEVKGVICSQV